MAVSSVCFHPLVMFLAVNFLDHYYQHTGQSLKMILNSSDSTKKKCFGNTSMSKAFFLHRILQCSLCFVSTSLLVHCSQCLLMLAGDVEQNPGPRLSRGKFMHVHVMILFFFVTYRC